MVFKKGLFKCDYDLYDGSIVSYVLGHSNNNPLVFKTLEPSYSTLLDGDSSTHS